LFIKVLCGEMTSYTCKDDVALSPVGETGCEFVVFGEPVLGVRDFAAASCEDLGDGFGDGGFFGDAQDLHCAKRSLVQRGGKVRY